jgi:hypothetical protein
MTSRSPFTCSALAGSMGAPMMVWMRIRGHAWRHGFDMAAAMLVPSAAVLGLVALSAARALPWFAQPDGPAMGLGMLGFMLVRRDHYAHGSSHHHHAATHTPLRPGRRPRGAQFAGHRLRERGSTRARHPRVSQSGDQRVATGAVEPIQSPTYSGLLPVSPTPDATKKIKVAGGLMMGVQP